MSYIETTVRHRRSSVTDTGAHAVEPYLSYLPVLQHESLWLDSALIPSSEANDIHPLLVLSSGARVVNASADGVYYDSSGSSVGGTVVDGVRVSAVRKRVRHALSTGSYGEVSSSTLDLRRLVPPGFSHTSTLLYTPVLEVISGDQYVPIADHTWLYDPAAGLIAPSEGSELPSGTIYLTAYEYVGRVGLTSSQLDPSSDDIPEGAVHEYYTHGRFLDSLGTVSLDDVANSATRRSIDASSMLSVGLSIGDVVELQLRPLQSAPSSTATKLYVQRVEGNDTLYFGDEPVGSAGAAATSDHYDGIAPDMATLGRFEGEFVGTTSGVHTGDVIGNVQGMVASIDNHRVIEAKLVGSGEGHWCGTMNGDVVGSFEGDAKITRGSIESAYHVVIGTHESTALLRVHGSASHVVLSHVSGGAASLECSADGTVSLDKALSASDVVCFNLSVGGDLNVARVYCDRIDSAGIWNHMYGMYDVGPIEDVTHMIANAITASSLSVAAIASDTMTSDFLSVASFFASSFFLDSVAYENLSVASVLATQLSVATLLVSNQLVIDEISVGTLFGYEADAGDTEELSVGLLVVSALSAGATQLRALSTGELHVGSGTLVLAALSVGALYGYDVSSELSVGELTVNALSSASIVTAALSASASVLASLSTGALLATSIAATQADIGALSVGTLHVDGVHGSLSANFASISVALQNKHPLTTVDSVPSSGSEALITSAAVYNAVSASAMLQQPLLVPGVAEGALPVQLTAAANPALSIAGGIDLHTPVSVASGEDVYITSMRANGARAGQLVDVEFRSVHGGAARESFTVKPGEDNAFNMQLGASTWSGSSHSNRRFESVHVFGKEHIRLFSDRLHLHNADGSVYSGTLDAGAVELSAAQSISSGNTYAARAGDVFSYLSSNYQPSVNESTALAAGSVSLTSTLSVGGAAVFEDVLNVAVAVTTAELSTASGVADSLSVGSLHVGVMLGSGLHQDIINTYHSTGDTTHDGNMLIDGNLLVTGAVLTGTHNRLINDLHAFEVGGALSVGSLAVETSCAAASVTTAALSVASIVIGTSVALPSNVQYVALRHSYYNELTALSSVSYDNASPFVALALGASGVSGFGTWGLGRSFRTVQQVGYDEHRGEGAFAPAAEYGSRFFRIECSITAVLTGAETVRLEILKNGAPIAAARLPASACTTTAHVMDFVDGSSDVLVFRLHNDLLSSDPWTLSLDHTETFLCSMCWQLL